MMTERNAENGPTTTDVPLATGERDVKFDAIWTINSVVFHANAPQRKRLIGYARPTARRRPMKDETRVASRGAGGRRLAHGLLVSLRGVGRDGVERIMRRLTGAFRTKSAHRPRLIANICTATD